MENLFITPESFGAIGDGVTDDSIAVQQAIDLGHTTGKRVLLAQKRYLITRTIHLYSGSRVEGNIAGNIDRSVQIGASLEFNLSDANSSAIEFNSGLKNEDNVYVDPSGCYKFILQNVGIINVGSNRPIGVKFTSDRDVTPREGLLSNLIIHNFSIGLLINAASYLRFQQLCITNYDRGIKIERNAMYMELCWFESIYLNTERPNSYGVELNSANNLYFNNIDINDAKEGFRVYATGDLFAIFCTKLNLVRCDKCVTITAQQAHITRLSFSEVTLLYNAGGYGLTFNRASYYVVADSSFSKIYDSDISTDYMIKNFSSVMDLSTCSFRELRALGKISGCPSCRSLNILNINPFGVFSIPLGATSVEYIVSARSVIDFVPQVMINCYESCVNYTVSTTNALFGNLKITINLGEPATKPLYFNYLIPIFI